MRTRGEGVKNSENFVDIFNGCPHILRRPPRFTNSGRRFVIDVGNSPKFDTFGRTNVPITRSFHWLRAFGVKIGLDSTPKFKIVKTLRNHLGKDNGRRRNSGGKLEREATTKWIFGTCKSQDLCLSVSNSGKSSSDLAVVMKSYQ